ncbi:hypothetical protein ACOI22_11030 [Glaciecola sp. 2405UD65-10]|uniref:hypothetical protein n=1 Tax=Glaciecola sp. 2405UD65-10 TaxID=3397244 RepID=UPI003B5CC19C
MNIPKMILAFSVGLIASQSLPAIADSDCQTIKTPNNFIRDVDGDQVDLRQIYNEEHFCYKYRGNDRPEICKALDHLKVPQMYQNKADFIGIPHRGIWGPKRIQTNTGMKLDHSKQRAENTFGAIEAATIDAKCRFVEIDVAMMGDIKKDSYRDAFAEGAGDTWQLFLGHYFRLHATDLETIDGQYTDIKGRRIYESFNLRPMNMPVFFDDLEEANSDINLAHMRLRNQTIKKNKETWRNFYGDFLYKDSYVRFEHILGHAKRNDYVLMVDPKVPNLEEYFPGASKKVLEKEAYNHEARLLARAMVLAYENAAEHHIVLKTASPLEEIWKRVDTMLRWSYARGPYDGRKRLWQNTAKRETFMKKFLWSPIPNKSASISENDTVKEIKAWHKKTNNSRGVATYEVAVYSPYHWTSSMEGSQNLMTYVLTELNGRNKIPVRPAMWSIDPMGDKGTFGREYNWKFFGNETAAGKEPDMRGNQHWMSSIPGVQYAVMNTDVPIFYKGTIAHKVEKSIPFGYKD